jgi:hypothetical protein
MIVSELMLLSIAIDFKATIVNNAIDFKEMIIITGINKGRNNFSFYKMKIWTYPTLVW